MTSIFKIRKVKPGIDNYIEPKVHTVNFENPEINDPLVQDYFSSRIKFLSACYDFAKKAKLEEDFDDN